MHRALVIRLGEALAPVEERLEAECAARRESGVLDHVRVAFLDAPPAGVGNLTNPVQVLRENLESDLAARLSDLLQMSVGGSGEFVLDVFVLMNLGEPLVANASSVVIDLLLELVDSHFRAIFPAHRTGTARRFRIIPIALLPAAPDCKKDRGEALGELHAMHDLFEDRRRTSEPEFPVDRVFLLDAITSRGIAPLGDLVDQTLSFLRVVILAALRREPDFVATFEADCNDLFASFGIACCEVDFLAVRETLSARMTHRTAQALTMDEGCAVPPVTDLLPLSVLTEPDALDRVLEELTALPVRTTEVEGSRCVRPLLNLYDELLERVGGWRDTDELVGTDSTGSEATETESPAPSLAAVAWGFVGGFALGVLVYGIAFFALALTAAASAATAGAFAVVAALMVWFVVNRKRKQLLSTRRDADDETEQQTRDAILDMLEHVVSEQRSKLRAVVERFDAVAAAVSTQAPPERPSAPSGSFRDRLVSDELLQLLYERQAAEADVRSLVDRWLESLGDWRSILNADVRPEAVDLEQYCRGHFLALGGQPMFADAECRECVSEVLAKFVDKWRGGIGVFIEGESRKQFDPDGFYTPLVSTLIGPPDLDAELGTCIRAGDGVVQKSAMRSRLDDVFIVSIVADVHPDAIAALADRGAKTN